MKRQDFIAVRREMSRKPVGELIELLSSADLRTRFFAEMSLRDRSGT